MKSNYIYPISIIVILVVGGSYMAGQRNGIKQVRDEAVNAGVADYYHAQDGNYGKCKQGFKWNYRMGQ